MSAAAVAVGELAARLRAAERAGEAIDPLTDERPFDVVTAYAVQDALLALHLRDGAATVGYKLGFTSVAKQRQMGHTDPIRGVLVDRMLRAPGRLSLEGLIQPRIEPEIGFRLGADLHGPDIGPDDVIAATATVFGALEILDSRYRDYRFTLPDVIADNTSAALVLVGELEIAAPDVDLVAEEAVLSVDGEETRRATGEAVLGHPARAVAWLASQVPLKAGDLVISGGMTDAVPLRPGAQVSVSYTSFGPINVEVDP
jgi:2-oxo-3-hexenedioate decarboxylase